jgi:hypothetical protein
MPRCAAGARARGVISRRPLYVMRSIEASSLSMLSCDSILSEADLRSSALTVLSRTVVHEMPFPQKRSRHGSQRTASGLLELTPAYPVRSSGQKTTPRRIDGWAASYVTRHAASSGWVLKVHDPAPVSPSHTRPFFTQISTHAVHRAWSRARVRDNNFTSGGRGPLHGRRSRSEGIIMHSTAAQSPFRQRACPSQPSCCPVHRRSYFRLTLDGH